jgi:hypothetical protein
MNTLFCDKGQGVSAQLDILVGVHLVCGASKLFFRLRIVFCVCVYVCTSVTFHNYVITVVFLRAKESRDRANVRYKNKAVRDEGRKFTFRERKTVLAVRAKVRM